MLFFYDCLSSVFYGSDAGPYRGREKRGKWEELGFFSPNGFAFLTVLGLGVGSTSHFEAM